MRIKDHTSKDHTLSRRHLLRGAAAGAALLASGLYHSDASAQTVKVGTAIVQIQSLSDTIANLDRQTEPYRMWERKESGKYSNAVGMPTRGKKDFVAIAVIDSKGMSFGMSYNESVTGAVKTLELPTDGRFDAFPNMFQNATGKTIERVKIYIEETTSKSKGDPVVTVMAIPVDANGTPISYKGGYLAMGISYYSKRGTAGGDMCLLLEPGVQGPIASL